MPFHVPLLDAGNAEGRVGRYTADPQVLAAMKTASAQTGTRFDVLLASATLESGLDPKAQAGGSSATGLFQFIDQSWLQAVRQYGPSHGLSTEAAAIVSRNGQLTVEDPTLRQHILDLRKDPQVASLLAGDSLSSISNGLTSVLGRAPDVTETYLGHFLGSGGAAQVLQTLKSDPSTPAASLLPAAARANPTMFRNSDGSALTVSQFVDKVRARVSRAYADLGLPMPQGGLAMAAAQLKTSGPTAQAVSVDAGTDGWGKGDPGRVTTAPARLMLAALNEVFLKVDRTMHGSGHGEKGQRPGTLPEGLLSGLQKEPSASGITTGA